MADGYLGKCRDCTKTDVKTNYAENIHEKRAYDRKRNREPNRVAARKAYSETPKGKSKSRAAKSRWVRNNRPKVNAEQRVKRAIEKGILVRQVCEVCGNLKTEAHHPNYFRPLDVMWLCTKHHVEWHNVDREKKRKAMGLP